jgi:pyruvate-ferredoxin/flavodoxin oxidoreductase
VVKHKAIDMVPKAPRLEEERASWAFFGTIPFPDRRDVRVASIKGSQMLEPLFAFSGACAGCGETPYLKLLSQLSGDRLLVANATGCSSIYGGNLPTTPWSVGRDGRGPAWANSLFEDNAEFGLGMRLSLDAQVDLAGSLLARVAAGVGEDLATAIASAAQDDEAGLAEQRARVAELKTRLEGLEGDDARDLLAIADVLVRKNVWIVGGDGWAYDIGFGGLDHVLASGRDVNVLVLDTQVYSNTGGQASKATPRGAVAKFAARGKQIGRKDLGMIAAGYGNVYVAQVAIGADNAQTVKALAEAEAWDGPSLVIAYSTCIEHGIDMATSMTHQTKAVKSGFWPLWRYDPRRAHPGTHPMQLDSGAPSVPLREFQAEEARFAMLDRTRPHDAERLSRLAQADADERRHLYEQLADVERLVPESVGAPITKEGGNGG